MTDRLLVGNCSAFYGDRLAAAGEMVRGGPLHVLTGDYLAELTMAILHKQRVKNPKLGYVPTFLEQMQSVLGECLDRSIRVVVNAGGLAPRALAEALGNLAGKLGLAPRIAFIEGDDLLPRLPELAAAGESLAHLDRGTPLATSGAHVLTANAYLGGWGVREALARGADVVIGGRLTDAALVIGAAAWRFEWRRDDWDQLAGALVAGHLLECGPQACGGNYSFIDEIPSWHEVGYPIAEMNADGSFVVTKHPGTGGRVSIGTVTAQLLYEIDGPRYLNPDVTARFDTLSLAAEGADRVRVAGVRGEPPPPTTKVCINTKGGYRNSLSIRLSGLDIEKKARIVEQMVLEAIGGRERFSAVDIQLLRSDRPDPRSNEEALAYWKITVTSPELGRVDKAFTQRVVECSLASIPGHSLAAPPAPAKEYMVYWPALVSNQHIRQTVYLEGAEVAVVEPLPTGWTVEPRLPLPSPPAPGSAPSRASRPAPLGHLFGARSGDKGGNANLGVWARTPAAFAWLRTELSTERLKKLLPDLAPFPIDRHELPRLLALNFVVRGLLGEGVASSTRPDPQGKTLGEYLRAKIVDLPQSLLEEAP